MSTANARSQLDKRLRDTFREIVDGKNVKRSRHELTFAGIDVSNVFIEEMDKKSYPERSRRMFEPFVMIRRSSPRCKRGSP